MKRHVPIAMLAVVFLCSLIASAAAEEPAGKTLQAVQSIAPACDETTLAEPSLEEPSLEELLTPSAQPVCSCRDRCFSDAQCEQLHGPGSQCVPVGSCQCRECLATS